MARVVHFAIKPDPHVVPKAVERTMLRAADVLQILALERPRALKAALRVLEDLLPRRSPPAA